MFREVHHVLYFFANNNDGVENQNMTGAAISDYYEDDQILKEGSMCGSKTVEIEKDTSL